MQLESRVFFCRQTEFSDSQWKIDEWLEVKVVTDALQEQTYTIY